MTRLECHVDTVGSTAEAELYGYMKGMVMPDTVGSEVEILEEVPYRMDWRWANCNMWEKEMENISVLSTPDGPWRARHLRLRSARTD